MHESAEIVEWKTIVGINIDAHQKDSTTKQYSLKRFGHDGCKGPNEMNVEYRRWFPVNPRTGSSVQVARLPLDAAIETEAVAIHDSRSS